MCVGYRVILKVKSGLLAFSLRKWSNAVTVLTLTSNLADYFERKRRPATSGVSSLSWQLTRAATRRTDVVPGFVVPQGKWACGATGKTLHIKHTLTRDGKAP
jgi:hypothetical protein